MSFLWTTRKLPLFVCLTFVARWNLAPQPASASSAAAVDEADASTRSTDNSVAVPMDAPRAVERRLLLSGGGNIAPAARARFVAWAGGGGARLLYIPWATELPEETCAEARTAWLQAGAGQFTCAPRAADMLSASASAKAIELFRDELRKATAVFFCGGDQVNIMKVIDGLGLREELRGSYERGIPFGGTSAGTAIMSSRMLTGEGDSTSLDPRRVGTAEGLGLLPPHVVVDQHFVRRQRENRLLAVLRDGQQSVGVGIDEDVSLALVDERRGEVFGDGPVLVFSAAAGTGKDETEDFRVRVATSGRAVELGAEHPEEAL